ncbi:MAG: hypothetical protein ACRDSR_08010 [Pseudonocardiaceae bacterium]
MTNVRIHLAETLTAGSIEGFLTPAETTKLDKIMSDFLAEEDRSSFVEQRTISIHEIPGHSTAQAMDVYEPAGRLEVPEIPAAAEHLLQSAFDRARPALARLVPSVTTCRPWTYVEYMPGQHITAHLDGIAPDPITWPRQIAGISIMIGEPAQGGEFYIETTSGERLWNKECSDPASCYSDGMWFAHDGADQSADWFRDMPRTRWNVNPTPGTALLYGSQLTHGTHPVIAGTARKFISWLIAENS